MPEPARTPRSPATPRRRDGPPNSLRVLVLAPVAARCGGSRGLSPGPRFAPLLFVLLGPAFVHGVCSFVSFNGRIEVGQESDDFGKARTVVFRELVTLRARQWTTGHQFSEREPDRLPADRTRKLRRLIFHATVSVHAELALMFTPDGFLRPSQGL